MDEKLRGLADQVTERPPRSKLEPYTDLIRELRRKRRTYEEIAQFFAEHLNLKVAPSTILAFIKVRARRQGQIPIELPSEIAPQTAGAVILGTETDVRDRIDALKRRKAKDGTPKPPFEFNEEDQLRIEANHKIRKA